MRSNQSFVLASLLVALGALAGCGNQEEGYCFPDGNCNKAAGGASGGGKGGSSGSAGSGGGVLFGGSAGNAGNGGFGLNTTGGSAGSGGGGNDCDVTKPKTCGSCDNDCTKKVQNVPGAAITCTMGKCGYDTTKTQCAVNYYDLDKDPSNGCEFGPCKKLGDKDDTCDGIDDNCNGKIDEDVDLCSQATCGSCKSNCANAFPNAEAECTKPAGACVPDQAKCEFKGKCKPGFYDGNGDPADGCEVKCTPTDLDGKELPPGQAAIEFCGDNIDNDCDGKVDFDDEDTQSPGPNADPRLFKECTGGDKGACFDTKGQTKCMANGLVCDGSPKPGEKDEICNNLDDDCNGFVDDALVDVGAPCGLFSFGICRKGQGSCENGAAKCLGEVLPENEICDNLDNDCDDIIDGTAPPGVTPDQYQSCAVDGDCPAGQFCRTRDSDNSKKVCALPSSNEGTPCDEPPADTVNPCKAGKTVCKNAAFECVGSVKSTTADKCDEDTNCNGVLEFTTDKQTDPLNCGQCGNDCNANNNHTNSICVNGQCQIDNNPATKCEQGFIDCDGDPNTCETACTFLSQKELCNGVDDNCDCNVDEVQSAQFPNGIVPPSPTQACGVLPGGDAADPGCGLKTDANPGGIDIKCQGGKFVCTFPAGRCDGGNPPSCAGTQDLCDGKDNDCDGAVDEDFKLKPSAALGSPCASDDGKGQSDGECRNVGVYTCTADGLNTECNATAKLKCGVAPGDPTFNQKPCDEVCDGKDNDCDGQIDEPRLGPKANPFDAAEARNAAPGASSGAYLKPAVIKIGDSLWIHQYEVTRPKATPTTSGNGNGYWGSIDTPLGATKDKTPACNDPVANNNNKIPWFNVTPIEVEETCNNMGGRICRTSEWKAACAVNGVGSATPKKDCKWGYGQNCTSSSATTCNLSLFDTNPAAAGNQDFTLPVASPLLSSCFSDWSGFFSNGTGPNQAQAQLFDMTGNLREITIVDSTVGKPKNVRQYALMGGAFNSDEGGATCDFSFYTVASDFQLFSVGFRCCFDEYPD